MYDVLSGELMLALLQWWLWFLEFREQGFIAVAETAGIVISGGDSRP